MRVIAAFILIPLALAAERFAWYASRAVTYQRINELGGDIESVSSMFAASLIGAIAAGVLAAALLPRVVLVAAALCCTAGYLLAGGADSAEEFVLAMQIAGAGAGAM